MNFEKVFVYTNEVKELLNFLNQEESIITSIDSNNELTTLFTLLELLKLTLKINKKESIKFIEYLSNMLNINLISFYYDN